MKKIATIFFIGILLIVNGCTQGSRFNSDKPERYNKTTNQIAAANMKLGIAYLQRGEYKKALDKLHRAKNADPDYLPTYNMLGVLYQQIGEKEKAEKHYLKALRLYASDPATLNNYGQFLCQEKRYDEASKVFSKAANDPLYEAPEIAFANIGLCAMLQGQLNVAEINFRKALEKNPGQSTALIKMAEISYETSSYLSARGYLQRYLAINDHSSQSLWLGIQIEQQLGDKDTLASYKLLLKNKFPDSKETKQLTEDSMLR